MISISIHSLSELRRVFESIEDSTGIRNGRCVVTTVDETAGLVSVEHLALETALEESYAERARLQRLVNRAIRCLETVRQDWLCADTEREIDACLREMSAQNRQCQLKSL